MYLQIAQSWRLIETYTLFRAGGTSL
jgi:hypothetical protein